MGFNLVTGKGSRWKLLTFKGKKIKKNNKFALPGSTAHYLHNDQNKTQPLNVSLPHPLCYVPESWAASTAQTLASTQNSPHYSPVVGCYCSLPPNLNLPNLTSMDGRFYQLMNGKWKNANGSAKGPHSTLQYSKVNKSVSVKTHQTKFIPLKKVFKVLFRIPGVFEMFNSFFKYMPTMAGNHSLLPSYICLHTLNILNTTKLAGNNHPGFTDTNSCSPTDRDPWTHHPNETGTDIFCSFLSQFLAC